MNTEDTAAIDEFREMYGEEAANALVQYLTKKRKDLTAHEVLEDDGAFERFSNWAYEKLGVDVYEKFAKHDVGNFFKRTNVEDFRKMRPGVDPNYNYFLRNVEKESKDVEDISQLDDREIAKTIADQFENITNVDISEIFNKDLSEPDTPLFNQDEIDKTMPSIKKWLDSYGIPANRQDDILYELDDVLSTKFQEMDEDPLVIDSIMSNESAIREDDRVTLTFGQMKKMIKEYKSLKEDGYYDDDDYEVCANCGAEIDPCDAYYVDTSEPYCSEDCLKAAGYTLDDVIDDIQVDSMSEARGSKKSAGPTLKEAGREVEKALKSIGATKIDRLDPKEEAKMVYRKNAGPDVVQYDLWLYKNPAKPKKGWSMVDNGSRISLSLYFGNGKDGGLKFHGHLGYSNGVATSSAFSNAPRGMWYVFKYGEPETFRSAMDLMTGGRGAEFYPCTQEMLHDIVEGVKDLQFYGNEFEYALKKARFTEIAWRKLCSLTQSMFNVPNTIGESINESVFEVFDEYHKKLEAMKAHCEQLLIYLDKANQAKDKPKRTADDQGDIDIFNSLQRTFLMKLEKMLQFVNDNNLIAEEVLSQNVKDIKDEDISKVYDELKKTGKTDDEIGKVIGGIISTKECIDSVLKNESIVLESEQMDMNTYWNRNGKYQDIANRLSGVSVEDLIEKFKIPYATASKFDRDRYQYYRFFNDGDTPTMFKKDIIDKFGEFPKYCDIDNDDLFNFVAPRLEALIDSDLSLVKPFVDKVPMEDSSIEETAISKKQLIIGDNNDGTITLMLTSQPSEDDKKMIRALAGDENIDFKKDPEYSYWYVSIKGKTAKEAEDFISSNFSDYAIEIDKDQDQIS